jgi:hypothetical protein
VSVVGNVSEILETMKFLPAPGSMAIVWRTFYLGNMSESSLSFILTFTAAYGPWDRFTIIESGVFDSWLVSFETEEVVGLVVRGDFLLLPHPL